MIDSFATMFAVEIINEVASHECYSFRDIFFGYNQVPIAKEDREKTTCVTDFNSFSYHIIPFGLKNAPTILSSILIKAFQEYIFKTRVVYFDN